MFKFKKKNQNRCELMCFLATSLAKNRTKLSKCEGSFEKKDNTIVP